MVKEYERRRDYAVKALNDMKGVSCKTPEGAFYIFVNIKELGKSSEQVANELLERAKVAVVAGSAFGTGGEGYIRISYATAYDRIVEAMERVKPVFEG